MAKTETIQTTCAYCGVGCGVLASTHEDGSVTVAGDPNHPANFGRLCSKGSALADTVGLEGRLLHPEVAGQQVSWDEALNTVSDGLTKVIAEHGPEAVAFYASGQLLTEDYYVANKLMKGFIGSANIDTNSRLCMASPVVGYKRAFGADAVPCSYDDLEQADLIVIEGSNTAWCHPVVFQRISKAKEDRPELKIVVIDPRKTATCEIADLHLAIKSGSDVALFNGLLNYLHQHEYIDRNFIKEHSNGFLAALVSAQKHDLQQTAEICGLTQSDIERFYQLYAANDKTVTLYSQGVNQSSSGTDNSNSIINCHIATGRIGKIGMGPFSITGQPNAMGGREVGGLSNQLAAHMELDNDEHRDLVSRFWQSDNLATTAGAKAVDLFNDVDNGKIKAVWIMATNPVVSMPDADRVKAALEKCELVIVSDCDKDTDTTQFADVLLPAQGWGEKDGTVTNSERRISHQRQFLAVAGEAKPDWWIISQVATRMGFADNFEYQSPVEIFREHAALSSFENNGSRDFNLGAMADISADEYAALQPIQWPVTSSKKGTVRLFENKQFFTDDGKANFIAVTASPPVNTPTEKYPLILNTGRIRDQWHTMTRTARSAKLNGHIPEPVLEIHPDDAQTWQLEEGAFAQVTSEWGKVVARIQVSDDQIKGSVFIPMHWNEQFAAQARVGAVINPVVDPLSGQPEFKHTPVNVAAYTPVWHGFVLSRAPIKFNEDVFYWVKIKGEHFWRYELAGEQEIDDPEKWAKALLTQEGDLVEFVDNATQRYRCANIINGQVETIVFISANHDLPTRTWLGHLFSDESLSDEQRTSLLAGKPGAGLPDVGPMVCACFGVGENTIKDAVADGKAKTIDDIGNLLKAGSNCGSCVPEIKKLLVGN
jgi:assimilatory nitrate reductase catalytic subunit